MPLSIAPYSSVMFESYSTSIAGDYDQTMRYDWIQIAFLRTLTDQQFISNRAFAPN